MYHDILKEETRVTDKNKSDNSADPEFHSDEEQYNKRW